MLHVMVLLSSKVMQKFVLCLLPLFRELVQGPGQTHKSLQFPTCRVIVARKGFGPLFPVLDLLLLSTCVLLSSGEESTIIF